MNPPSNPLRNWRRDIVMRYQATMTAVMLVPWIPMSDWGDFISFLTMLHFAPVGDIRRLSYSAGLSHGFRVIYDTEEGPWKWRALYKFTRGRFVVHNIAHCAYQHINGEYRHVRDVTLHKAFTHTMSVGFDVRIWALLSHLHTAWVPRFASFDIVSAGRATARLSKNRYSSVEPFGNGK
jgi:hypothetical protein